MVISEQEALILLSRGGYGAAPVRQLETIARSVRQRTSAEVATAYVEQNTPSLPDALTQLAENTSFDSIHIVPVFIPSDDHLLRWFGKVIQRWQLEFSTAHERTPTILLHKALGDMPSMGETTIQALSELYARFEPLKERVKADPPAWSVIPPHQRRVLFCMGPRCMTRGAGTMLEELKKALNEHHLLDDSTVLVARTGCQYPCNLGPLMTVYPSGVWYCGLDKEAIWKIVEQDFVAGQISEQHAYYPSAVAQRVNEI